MNVGSLFSGIGGLDYGLSRAGWEHAFFCESDPWRRDVLRAHWPGVPVYEDVRAVAVGEPEGRAAADGRGPSDNGRGRETRAGIPSSVDLLTGGFPCQDLSVAGQRRGLAGARSGLFHEFARIINTVRPRLVLLENVPGLLSSNGGRDFGVVLGTLADIGYGVGWRVLDSRFFGVPQRRRRVFIVAARADTDTASAARCAGEILAVGTRCTRHSQARAEEGEAAPVPSVSGTLGGRKGFTGDDIDRGGAFIPVSYALNAKRGNRDDGESETFVAAPLTSGGHPNSNMPGRRKEDDVNLVTSITLASDPISAVELAQPSTKRNGDPGVISSLAQGVRRLTPIECERLQGLPDGWTAYGPDSRRYSSLGDAVTATVGEWLGRRIADAL